MQGAAIAMAMKRAKEKEKAKDLLSQALLGESPQILQRRIEVVENIYRVRAVQSTRKRWNPTSLPSLVLWLSAAAVLNGDVSPLAPCCVAGHARQQALRPRIGEYRRS